MFYIIMFNSWVTYINCFLIHIVFYPNHLIFWPITFGNSNYIFLFFFGFVFTFSLYSVTSVRVENFRVYLSSITLSVMNSLLPIFNLKRSILISTPITVVEYISSWSHLVFILFVFFLLWLCIVSVRRVSVLIEIFVGLTLIPRWQQQILYCYFYSQMKSSNQYFQSAVTLM